MDEQNKEVPEKKPTQEDLETAKKLLFIARGLSENDPDYINTLFLILKFQKLDLKMYNDMKKMLYNQVKSMEKKGAKK